MTKYIIPGLIVISLLTSAYRDRTLNEQAHDLIVSRRPLQACQLIVNNLRLDKEICSSESLEIRGKLDNDIIDVDTLQLLGITLQQLGQFDTSISIIQLAVDKSKYEVREKSSLTLANVLSDKYQWYIRQYYTTDNYVEKLRIIQDIENALTKALTIYQQLKHSDNQLINLKSRINYLILVSKIDTNITKLSVESEIIDESVKFLESTFENARLEMSTIDELECRVGYVSALLILAQKNQNFLELAFKQATFNSNLKQLSTNSSFEVQNQFLLGKILFKKGLLDEAKLAFQKSLIIAKVARDPSSAFRNEWELGKIFREKRDRQYSLIYYEAASRSLNEVREKMLPFSSQIKFGFLEQTTPMFQEYMAMLFEVDSPNLENIIRIYEKFQITELENYLKCTYIPNLVSILDLPYSKKPDVSIYLIELPHAYKIIYYLKSGSTFYRSINKKVFDSEFFKVKEIMQSDDFEYIPEQSIKEYFNNLYNQIIGEAKDKFPSRGKIVLVLDSKLQSIPWGLLNDGSNYLIENYSLSTTLNSKVILEKNKDNNSSNILLAGISNSPNIGLNFIKKEINGIADLFKDSMPLLDKKFTTNTFTTKSSRFSIIHVASHGEFSSNPDSTYIKAWDKRLKLSDLQQLVRYRSTPIELLVLSACETALGDRRAVLGLAGATVQSGASSSVGTLWRVDDESQAILMQLFYKGLKQGKSKAEALRSAQVEMRQNNWPAYHWAGTVLVGAW
jgi:CHAT domain-containing protein